MILVMKLREGFVIREVAGSTVVVPTGDLMVQYSKMFTINEVGKFIIELLQEQDFTINEIVEKIIEEYDIDEGKAMQDTENFIEKLKEDNMLES